jgi:hypothetical protein
MAQPQVARITCSQCDGWYDSERELRDHMQAAHRRFDSEQSTFQPGGTHPDSFKNQLGTSKEERKENILRLTRCGSPPQSSVAC